MANTFKLTKKFIEGYENLQPDWGPLGYVVYKRSYARELPNGSTEEWWQTCERVVEGTFELQKRHVEYLNTRWDAWKAQKSAQEMFRLMWDFKFLPAGRGLFQMGAPLVMEDKNAAALLNCAFISTDEIEHDFAEPFCFCFSASAHGIGVGFDTEGVGLVNIIEPKYSENIIVIDDSREGWVDALRDTLYAYVGKGSIPKFDYSKIRPFGSKIKRFGGTASGPQALQDLLEIDIPKVLTPGIITSTQITDIMCCIAKCVVAGGARRSALIAMGKPDDDEFINLKTDEEKVKEYRWASNNSISCPSSYKNFEKFVEPIMLNGEPGFVMLHNCQKYGRMNGILDTRDKKAKGVNPCLSGDTLVYVADGRGTVSIKQLSEENKDIPVFCLDDKNNLVVRYMRNPRLTGKNEQIIKITLENGHMLKSTPDHKFLTSNNGYMNAKDLMIGQGLSILTRYKSKINNSKKDYWWTKFNEYKNLEHRIIGKFIYPKLENDLTIHHKNFDSLDNTNDNLEIMTRKEHLILHNKLAQVQGEKNPNFCGVTNDKLKEHALKLTKIKQRKFSWSEWKLYAKKNDLPYDFSDWRKKHLNSIAGLAKWAAKKLGYEHYNLDPRKIKTLEELLEQGYDCEVKNNKILIKKLCEICEKPFLIDSNYREQSLCSNACTLRNLKILGSKKIYPKSLGSNQIDIYNDLCKNLNRIPKLREWKKSCKENNVDYTLYHKNSPFNSYTELQKSAKLTNHKIIKLETVDSEDVYNGTVDEFHNFFVGGYDEGGDTIFTNNLQCGEQVLESGECCNLVELFPSRCESLDEFKRAIKYAYLYAKTVTLTKTPWPRTNEIMLRNRRIGLGMAGIIENINRLGFAEHISWCEEGYTYVQELDKTYSDWLCIPRSIRTTTSKPGGTTPFLPGVTPGIHYPHSKYYIRNIRITRGNPLLDALKKAGYQIEQDKYEKSSMVVSFPVKENHFTRGKYDVTMWEQLENAAQMQEHWSDNSVSITVTVKPEEKDQLVEALDRYQSRLKTVSFLPLKDHNYEQAPYIKITEKEYKRLVKKLKKLDLSKTEHEITEKFCDGDTCTI